MKPSGRKEETDALTEMTCQKSGWMDLGRKQSRSSKHISGPTRSTSSTASLHLNTATHDLPRLENKVGGIQGFVLPVSCVWLQTRCPWHGGASATATGSPCTTPDWSAGTAREPAKTLRGGAWRDHWAEQWNCRVFALEGNCPLRAPVMNASGGGQWVGLMLCSGRNAEGV